jgi:hypothetical protein
VTTPSFEAEPDSFLRNGSLDKSEECVFCDEAGLVTVEEAVN